MNDEQQSGQGMGRRKEPVRVSQAAPDQEPPTGVTVDVTLTPPGTQTEVNLGSMHPADAMALLNLLQDASALILEDTGNPDGREQELPPPTGYVVVLDAANPGRLAVRTTFDPRLHHQRHNGHEDLGVPGGDSHSGPASLVVVLDHWSEEHGYRFVHTTSQLNQPLEQFVASLGPDDRQRVVIAHEEEEGGIVRIGEADEDGAEIFEVAALSMDWISRLPPPL